jgi:hypothetical protein
VGELLRGGRCNLSMGALDGMASSLLSCSSKAGVTQQPLSKNKGVGFCPPRGMRESIDNLMIALPSHGNPIWKRCLLYESVFGMLSRTCHVGENL